MFYVETPMSGRLSGQDKTVLTSYLRVGIVQDWTHDYGDNVHRIPPKITGVYELDHTDKWGNTHLVGLICKACHDHPHYGLYGVNISNETFSIYAD